MKKSLFLLILPFLVVGCGSGGSSSGSGGACRITDGELEVCANSLDSSAMVGSTGDQDVDVVDTVCSDPDEEEPTPFVRKVGILNVAVEDRGITIPLLSDQKRVTLQSYRVSYTGGPPALMRTGSLTDFEGTNVLRDGDTEPIRVTLLTIGQIRSLTSTFRRTSAGVLPLPVHYNVRVTFDGVEHPTGDSFTISAATELAVADFDNCM